MLSAVPVAGSGGRYNPVSWLAADRSAQGRREDWCSECLSIQRERQWWRVIQKSGKGGPNKVARSARARESPRPKRRMPAPPDAAPIVVGVGASAGGLEAFTELLSNLPDDTGMAFVLIQHLDPRHGSHLTELLAKACKMPVSEVKGETLTVPNHVYVIPPQANLGISHGMLHTPPRADSGRNMPVDSFLRTLAADRGARAIGVVLSGTASDGTLGLQAVKAAGGITFAQERQSAKFDSMPASAIAAGVVDYVLPPAGYRAAVGGHRWQF